LGKGVSTQCAISDVRSFVSSREPVNRFKLASCLYAKAAVFVQYPYSRKIWQALNLAKWQKTKNIDEILIIHGA